MDVVDRVSKEINSLSEKPLIYGFIGMLLGIYGPRLHHNLPQDIKNLLQMMSNFCLGQ